jgi:hypothetical protein
MRLASAVAWMRAIEAICIAHRLRIAKAKEIQFEFFATTSAYHPKGVAKIAGSVPLK